MFDTLFNTKFLKLPFDKLRNKSIDTQLLSDIMVNITDYGYKYKFYKDNILIVYHSKGNVVDTDIFDRNFVNLKLVEISNSLKKRGIKSKIIVKFSRAGITESKAVDVILSHGDFIPFKIYSKIVKYRPTMPEDIAKWIDDFLKSR